MPRFSDLSSMSMYYSGSPSATTYNPYTTVTATPIGASYSSTYLGSGGNYSAHSSLGGYSRAPPLSSRYVSTGRTYSPMLTTISERGTSSPVRVNSPRRLPISAKYSPAAYVPRPVNINTADIDVSRDRYRTRPAVTTTSSYTPSRDVKKYSPTPVHDSSESINSTEKIDDVRKPSPDSSPPPPDAEEGPFMPRIDGQTGPGEDNAFGLQRSTIRRGRTVVRLHTLKRKGKDSPRKAQEELNSEDATQSESTPEEDLPGSNKSSPKGSKWREKLSDDLIYVEKRGRKTPGEKLVEKFILRDKNEDEGNISRKNSPPSNEASPPKEVNVQTLQPVVNKHYSNKSPERRCSMELLAEQANVLDSLIRNENLSTTCLDISKIGTKDWSPPKTQTIFGSAKKRKSIKNNESRLQTTQSDHAIHERVKSLGLINKDNRTFSRKSSVKKSASGGNICRLDSIVELSREPLVMELPPIEENKSPVKVEKLQSKPKQKTKITSTVEISQSPIPLKVRVGNVTVEQKINEPKKEISFTSAVEEKSTYSEDESNFGSTKRKIVEKSTGEPVSYRKDHEIKKVKSVRISSPPCDSDEAESDDCNFWDKIGKRETVYLKKRQQNIQEELAKRRAMYWLPEEDDEETGSNESTEINTECPDLNRDLTDVSMPNEVIENMVENVEKESINNSQQYDADKIKLSKAPELKIINKLSNNTSKVSNNIDMDVPSINESLQIIKDNLEANLKSSSSTPTISETQENRLANEKYTYDLEKKRSITSQNDPKTVTGMSIQQLHECAKTNPDSKSSSSEIKDVTPEKINESIISQVLSKQQSPKSKNAMSTSKKETVDKTIPAESKGKKTYSDSELKPQALKETSPKNKGVIKLSKDSDDKLFSTESKEKEQDTCVESKDSANCNKKISPKNKQIPKNIPIDADKNVTLERKSPKSDTSAASSQIKPIDKISPTKTKPLLKDNVSVTAQLTEKSVAENKTEIGAIKDSTSDSFKSDSDSKEYKIEDSSSGGPDNNYVEVKPETLQENRESQKKFLLSEPIVALFENNDIPNAEMVVSTVTPFIPTFESTKLFENTSADTLADKTNLEETTSADAVKLPETPVKRKPVKDEPMVRPIYATPRPLQKKVPQIIHSSSSSETSSDEESDGNEDEESTDSEVSTEFYECDNAGQDGRTSTGSNDSGFDSSAPTSPAGFVCVKKDCDVNCHRKCEKLTANLCGVNQRLLVEALATRASMRRGGETAGAGTSAPQANSVADTAEGALESSTAYGVFRRTGRVTPPAKSIPRFRKYTIEDFHFLKVLGKGSFGKVLLAELRDTEYYYAVKCLKKDVVLEDDDVECTLIERKVLALGTNHPYLCHLFATFQTDSHLFFVMEYLNGGDLMFHIQQSGRFPEPRAKFYAAEIVSGLKFLHKRGIIYRDLKLDNILLDYEGHVRIADFGMCKLQIYLEKTADTFCGTPDYMAPEIIKGLKYNQAVDWWSFGVLLYEMLIGQSPFSGCDEDELFWSICNELPSYPRFLSQEAHDILVRLLDKDALTRLGGTDCLHGDVRDQDFFHSIHWERLDRRELESPFRPRVRHPYDTQYFDRAFTGERPRLTAVELNVLRTMDQQPFRGFSYTNPNATDR